MCSKLVLAAAVLPLALLLPATAAGASAPEFAFPTRSARVVSYDMQVRLDAEAHVVSGRQVITWRNDSDEAVPSLWLHLYLNAFLDDRSTLVLEGGERVSREWLSDEVEYWGWCRLLEMKLADGRDLLKTLEYRQPDDGNPDDRTVARVLLPEPVPPGGTVELQTRFESKLPLARRRTGHAGDYHFAAQWFPKLGKYVGVEAQPETEGWYCHQYHAHTEFFADYGTYRVALTVPPEYGGEPARVGATGELVERSVLPGEDGGDGWATLVFAAADVHDFTWAADPDFLVLEREYVHEERRTEAVVEEERFLREEVGVPAEQLALPNVTVRLLLQPDHAHLADRHFEATFQAITWYGLWYGPYPYGVVTVVDPQHDGRATGGMEYPMLFTAGARWFDPPASLRPEGVTVHEYGHQYFYGLIGNNEAEEAWLDEGLNSYSDDKVLDRGWGGRIRHHTFGHVPLPLQAHLDLPSGEDAWEAGSLLGFRTFGRRPGSLADRLYQHPEATWARSVRVQNPLGSRRRTFDHWTKDPLDRTSFRTLDRGSYRTIAYSKPALLLTTWERLLGRATFLRAMRAYSARWRFRHPTGADFLAVLEEVAGYPAEEARRWLQPEVLDYAVASVEVREETAPRGVTFEEGEPVFVDRPEDDPDDVEAAADERWRSAVRVHRRGTLTAPVRVAVTFADADEPELFDWDGVDTWHELAFVRDRKVVAVDVDPEYVHALDEDRLNNHWRDEEDCLPSLSWAARVLAQVQAALLGARTLS